MLGAIEQVVLDAVMVAMVRRSLWFAHVPMGTIVLPGAEGYLGRAGRYLKRGCRKIVGLADSSASNSLIERDESPPVRGRL